MNETNLPNHGAPTDEKVRDGDLKQTARDVGAAASERMHELRDAAESSVENAKSAAADKADEVKGQTADEIGRTAKGLDAAADAMDGSPIQQDLLREAADGLKQLAQAVEGKSLGAMAGDVSAFGRRNPMAFLGGAALAGFALARFARASSPDGSTGMSTSAHHDPYDRTTGFDPNPTMGGTAAAPRPSEPVRAPASDFAGGSDNA